MTHIGIIEELPIENIQYSRNPVREDLGSIEELAYSISMKGLLHPIIVRAISDDRYEVVAGNRRLQACKVLGWRKIPCNILELDDREAFEVSLIENIQRKTLNPIEEAKAFKKYIEEYGWGGITDLAGKIGKSQTYVSRRIQLLQLPITIQEKIMRRRISPSIAQELLSMNPEVAEKLAEMIEKEKLRRKEVRCVIKTIDNKMKCDSNDDETNDINEYDLYHNISNRDEIIKIIDSALMRCITTLRLALTRIDSIIEDIDKEDWIIKDILLQYRLILHGDIDAFIRLRKKLKLLRNNKAIVHARAYENESLDNNNDGKEYKFKMIHQYKSII